MSDHVKQLDAIASDLQKRASNNAPAGGNAPGPKSGPDAAGMSLSHLGLVNPYAVLKTEANVRDAARPGENTPGLVNGPDAAPEDDDCIFGANRLAAARAELARLAQLGLLDLPDPPREEKKSRDATPLAADNTPPDEHAPGLADRLDARLKSIEDRLADARVDIAKLSRAASYAESKGGGGGHAPATGLADRLDSMLETIESDLADARLTAAKAELAQSGFAAPPAAPEPEEETASAQDNADKAIRRDFGDGLGLLFKKYAAKTNPPPGPRTPLEAVEAIRRNHAPDKEPLATFTGNGAELFRIMLVNFIFTVLTLGIYHFWGKVKVRQYLWQRTRVLGSPLEYTGNALELLQSFLIVLAALALVSVAADFSVILAWVLAACMLWVIHFAIYRSIRFRLTRTRWRGIYANLSGSAVAFANTAAMLTAANILCLGLLTPLVYTRLCALVVNNIWWGDTRLSFDGKAGALYNAFIISAVTGFMTIFMIGIILGGAIFASFSYMIGPVSLGSLINLMIFWLIILCCFSYYAGTKLHWLLQSISMPNAQFHSGLPPMVIIGLCFTNTLLLVFTLGLASPWVAARTCRYLAAAIVYEGEINADALTQNTQPIPSRGDGLLDALDLDVAF